MLELAEEHSICDFDFIEPWRCDNCHELMYNKNEAGYPAPGAPVGVEIKYGGGAKRVCSLCMDLYITILKNEYFKLLALDWLDEHKSRENLKSGRNYLDR